MSRTGQPTADRLKPSSGRFRCRFQARKDEPRPGSLIWRAVQFEAATQQAARRSRVAAERKVQEQERRKEGAMKKKAVDTEQAATTATSKRRASSVRSSRRRSSARRSSGVGHRRSVSPTRGQVAALGHIAE